MKKIVLFFGCFLILVFFCLFFWAGGGAQKKCQKPMLGVSKGLGVGRGVSPMLAIGCMMLAKGPSVSIHAPIGLCRCTKNFNFLV